MNQEQRDSLEKEVIATIVNRANLIEKREQQIERDNEDIKVQTLTAFATNEINPKTELPWTGVEVLKVFKQQGIEVNNTLINSLTSPSTETDNTVKNEAELQRDLQFGKISSEDIEANAVEGKITWKGYARLLKEYTNIILKYIDEKYSIVPSLIEFNAENDLLKGILTKV